MKAESRERLREIGKIRKMEEGDLHGQLMAVKQILALHNIEQVVTFGPQDFARIQMPHEDPLVITLKVANCIIKRVLMDGGSVVNVMFYSTFQQIGLPDEEIVPVTTPSVGFHKTSMVPMGTIELEVTVGHKC